MDSEQLRRVILRVVTSLMNLIIGPSGAWYALGMRGIFIYIFLTTFTKFISAEIFSVNEKISKFGYRISPIFLLLAGFIPLLFSDWYAFVIIIPILLGAYVGTFWTAFHGIRKLKKVTNERKSVRAFQYYEIASTISAASIVLLLKYIEFSHFAGYIGASLAFIALIIPMNLKGENIGFSTNDLSSKKAILARLTTGSFGIIGFSLIWCMRIIALKFAGISGIAAMVAISSTIGFIVSEINERTLKPRNADERNWKIGNYLQILGIIVMMISLFLYQEKFILFGYLITKAGTSGILHPLEVRISGELLSGDEKSIGLRERLKFRNQVKILMFYMIFNLPIIYILGEINIQFSVGLALITCLSYSVLNLETFNKLRMQKLV